VVAGPTSSERMSTPATANDAASAAISAAGCTHGQEQRAERGRDEHARFEEAAVDGVDTQEAVCADDARDAGAVAGLRHRAEELRADHDREDRPDRPGGGADDHRSGEQTLREGAPAGDATRAEAIREVAAGGRSENTRRDLCQHVRSRYLGLIGEAEEQHCEGDHGQPVAIGGNTGCHQEASGTVAGTGVGRSSRRKPRGVDRHLCSLPRRRKRGRRRGPVPRRRTQRIQQARVCTRDLSAGTQAQPVPSATCLASLVPPAPDYLATE
jgi:hypothetical protein